MRIKPGQLLQWSKENILPRFACINEQGLIDNSKSWHEWHKISYNEHLLVLGEMKLSKETMTAISSHAAMDAATAAMAGYKQFQNEWNKQGYVNGYVCLTANNSRIWISHIDMKHFEAL